jgi:hypothetical protein
VWRKEPLLHSTIICFLIVHGDIIYERTNMPKTTLGRKLIPISELLLVLFPKTATSFSFQLTNDIITNSNLREIHRAVNTSI